MNMIEFEGWKNCVQIENGAFRLIVSTDVGPFIIGAFLGESPNFFYVNPEIAGKTGGDEWKFYGGHRLWHSPEAKPRTYEVENTRVEFKELRDGVCFSYGTNKMTGMHKSFTVKPMKNGTFCIEHRLRNNNLWDVELAAWALSVMAPGGVAIIPQPQGDKTALLPNRYLTVWPYTDMSDKRLAWGNKFTLLRQDISAGTPCKFGLNCEDGWLAYVNKGYALIKSFEHLIDAEYPDNGCSVEVYTNDKMLEIETLSPLYLLAPGEEILHVEYFKAVEKTGEINTAEDAEGFVNKFRPGRN